MQQVFVIAFVLLVQSLAVAQQPYAVNYCPTLQADHAKYVAALDMINASNRNAAITAAKNCAGEDAAFDPEDDEFSCADINENCPLLAVASIEDLRSLKTETASLKKDLQDAVEEKMTEQSDLKTEAAKLAKDYAEREDDLNGEIVTQEKEYKEQLQEKDKAALAQVQEIQGKISQIANANREIVLKANRAMAELAAAKLNAKKACREQARTDYQAILKQLDEQIKARGGKVAGGFEGIQNAENYRRFLVAKIKSPEPSERFTLCYSVGDAVETDLQQRNMGGALTMNEFTSQIEENNKQRDQLTQQLQQQQQLAQQQKIEGYQEQMKAIQTIQKKILTSRQSFERESRAMSEKMAKLEALLTRKQADLGKAIRKASNAEDRYNCLTGKGLAKSGADVETAKKAYAVVRNSTLDTDCLRVTDISQPGCEVCASFRSAGTAGPASTGSQADSVPSSSPVNSAR